MSENISRQAAIDALDEQIAQCNKAIKSFALSMKDEYAVKVEKASLTAFRERLEYLPPAQPEPHYDEWCTDCKEYDKERHCCPRWNKVIRQALADAQPKRTGKWIKITKGAMREKYMCSICGRTIEEDGIERLVPIKYPFCHCGAKMVGAKNESD